MTMEFPDLKEIDDAVVDRAYAFITQLVREKHPDIDARRGLVGDLVCGLHAMLHGATQEMVDRVRRSLSLSEIMADPEDADPAIVDRLLSNYCITRKPAVTACGRITIVLRSALATNILKDSVFIADNGQRFRVTQTCTARAHDAAVPRLTDRTLVALGDYYAFTVDVVAEEAVPDATLPRLALLHPVKTIATLVRAYAEDDFSDSRATETNEELLHRLRSGIAGRGFSSRENIRALINTADTFEHPGFADLEDIVIIGTGDTEMVRDQRGIFPVSSGGKIDIYLHQPPRRTGVRVEAVLQEQTEEGGIWKAWIYENKAPGYYAVWDICPEGADPHASYCTLQNDVRFVAKPAGYAPDVRTATEATYTCYQTAEITFIASNTDTSLCKGAVAPYMLTVIGVPLIAEVQHFLNQRELRPPAGDVLVKAPTPCFISVEIVVTGKTDAAPIKRVVADFIVKHGRDGKLDTDGLTYIINQMLPHGISIADLTLAGQLLCPDGKAISLESPLVIPTVKRFGLSPRTVGMFLKSCLITEELFK